MAAAAVDEQTVIDDILAKCDHMHTGRIRVSNVVRYLRSAAKIDDVWGAPRAYAEPRRQMPSLASPTCSIGIPGGAVCSIGSQGDRRRCGKRRISHENFGVDSRHSAATASQVRSLGMF